LTRQLLARGPQHPSISISAAAWAFPTSGTTTCRRTRTSLCRDGASAASAARPQDVTEPGRLIVGNAGILVTRVIYVKETEAKPSSSDAAMNDLIRPTLYEAWHEIQPVVEKASEP
jgi:diaminopimelate decarboxylase